MCAVFYVMAEAEVFDILRQQPWFLETRLRRRADVSVLRLPKAIKKTITDAVKNVLGSQEQAAVIVKHTTFTLASIEKLSAESLLFKFILTFGSEQSRKQVVYRVFEQDMVGKRHTAGLAGPDYGIGIAFVSLRASQMNVISHNNEEGLKLFTRSAKSADLRGLRSSIAPDMYARFDAAMAVLYPSGPERSLAAEMHIEAVPAWVTTFMMPVKWRTVMNDTQWKLIYGHSKHDEEMQEIVHKLGAGYFYIRLGSGEDTLTVVDYARRVILRLSAEKNLVLNLTNDKIAWLGSLDSAVTHLEGMKLGKMISVTFPPN